MKIVESKDADQISAVLKHADIYKTIADDTCPDIDDFNVHTLREDTFFIVGMVEDAPIAVMVYHKTDDKWYCHVQVLPEFRKRYSEVFGAMALDWFFDNIGGGLYAIIPECYQNVTSFAELFGFYLVGYDKKKYLKDGIEYVRLIYKLERE